MSPAFDAAIATIVPTVRTAARAFPSVQPAAAKSDAIAISVTSVMPDVGCEETPTMPTMRAATATKRTPKTPTPAAQTARGSGPMWPAEDPGHERGREDDERDAAEHEAAGQVAVRARDASGGIALAPPRPPRTPFTTARNAPAIVGKFLRTVRMPAVATAPAPM